MHDLRFDSVVEIADDFCDAVVVVCGEHDVCYDVDVSFVDPGEWTFDAAVQMVDFEAVDADSGLFVPMWLL